MASTDKGPISGIYRQNILSLHDPLVKPTILKQMYQEHGGQFHTFMNFMDAFGMQFDVNVGEGNKYSVFFNGWKTFPFTVLSAVADPGVGNPITITLSPDDHKNSGTSSYPAFSDTVYIPNTGAAPVAAYVHDKSTATNYAHTLTLMPKKSTDNIGAIAAGTQLFVGDQNKGYGTSQGQGLNTGEIQRDFYMQISENNYGAQGHLLTQPTWVEIYNDEKVYQGSVMKELADMEFRLDKKIGFGLLLGDEITNPNLVVSANEASWRGDSTDEGAQIGGTKGIWRWGTELGYTSSITADTMDWNDVRAIRDHWESEAVSASIGLITGGYKRISEISRLVETRNSGNGTDYARTKDMVSGMIGMMNNSGLKTREGLIANFDFKSFTDGGVSFLLQEIADFSDPRTLGLSDFAWQWNAMVIPFGTTVTGSKLGGKKDRIVPNIGIAYQRGGQYSRRMEMWMTGAADGTYTNTKDQKNWHKRVHFGAFAANANQFFMITG